MAARSPGSVIEKTETGADQPDCGGGLGRAVIPLRVRPLGRASVRPVTDAWHLSRIAEVLD